MERLPRLPVVPIPVAIYLGFLVSCFHVPSASVLFGLALSYSSLVWLLSSEKKLSVVLKLLLIYTIFKMTYYVMLNYPLPLQLSFFGAEGRFMVSLMLMISVLLHSYSTSEASRILNLCYLLFVFSSPALVFLVISRSPTSEISHHQVGFVFVSGLILQLAQAKRQTPVLFWIGIALICLLILNSHSRMAVLVAVLLVGYVATSNWKTIARLSALVALVVFPSILTPNLTLGGRQYSLDWVADLDDAFSYGYENAERIMFANEVFGEGFNSTDHNMLGRFLVYGKAVGHFVSSPIVGIGVGKFDDGSQCRGDLELVCVHDDRYASFVGGTAHNVYLHILAEEGILGIILFGTIVFLLWQGSSRIPEFTGLVRVLLIAYLFSGLYHHVFVSPIYVVSLLLPVLVVVSTERGGRMDNQM